MVTVVDSPAPLEEVTPAPSGRGWARRLVQSELLVVAVEYCALIALATYPAVLRLRSEVIGDAYSDMWKHLWGLWWYYDALVRNHEIPLFSTLINYPQGGYLYFADPLTAVLSVPFQPFLGVVCTYNILILLHLLGGCLGAYLLAREVGLARRGSFLAGLIYGLAPCVLAYAVSSGVTETVNLAWPPMFVLYLLRSLRDGLRRDQVLAGVFLFLTAFSCWYYSEFMLLMMALLFVFGPTAPTLRPREWRWYVGAMVERVRLVIPILVVGFCLILPFAAAFAQTIRNPYNLVMPEKVPERTTGTISEYMGESQLNYTGLLDFVRPGKEHSTTTDSMDRLIRVYYLGWIAMGLVGLGLLLTPRPYGRSLRFWLWTTLGFLVLTLGPNIHLQSPGGANVTLCSSWPYLFVYHCFPLFKQIAQPFRMMLLVYLGLGILAGMALQRLEVLFPSVQRFLWMVPVAVLAETLYMSPTPYPMPMASATPPPIYRVIGDTPGTSAVWDIPGEHPGGILQPSEYYFYQTFHGRPIPYRTSGEVSRQVKENPVHMVVGDLLHDRWDDRTARPMLVQGLESCRRMKIQYLVVHRLNFGVQRAFIFSRAMTAVLGPANYQDEDVIVYRLY